eukprot:NODE_648_length_5041_cov_0.519021.p5 type:complete len:116 gc:universal NODE_648_length_5041_cov_0.519021:2519-2866(+)
MGVVISHQMAYQSMQHLLIDLVCQWVYSFDHHGLYGGVLPCRPYLYSYQIRLLIPVMDALDAFQGVSQHSFFLYIAVPTAFSVVLYAVPMRHIMAYYPQFYHSFQSLLYRLHHYS